MCMGETMKTGSRQAVIAIRISEPMFQVVNGNSMEHIQKASQHSAFRYFLNVNI